MSRLIPASLRGLPGPALVLVVGTLINRAGTFVIPFLAIYLSDERGLSPAFAGLALGLYGAGGMVAALAGGWVADRVGRKPVLVLCPLATGLLLLALYASQAPPLVLLMSFLAGVTGEATRPASSATMADVVPPERRVDAFALWRLVVNLGFTVGLLVGGVLITRVGFGPVFIADALTTWAYAVVVLVWLPETKPAAGPSAAPAAGERAPSSGFGEVIADRVFRRLWVGSLLTAGVFSQTTSTMPIALAQRGLSTDLIGALIGLNGLIIICTELPLARRLRPFPAHRVMALGSAVMGLGFASTGAVATSVPLLALTVLIWTTGEMIGAPRSQAYLAGLAPPLLRGRYSGAYGLSWSLAFMVGPPLGGALLDASPLAYWTGCAALGLGGALACLGLPPERPLTAVEAADVLAAESDADLCDTSPVPRGMAPDAEPTLGEQTADA